MKKIINITDYNVQNVLERVHLSSSSHCRACTSVLVGELRVSVPASATDAGGSELLGEGGPGRPRGTVGPRPGQHGHVRSGARRLLQHALMGQLRQARSVKAYTDRKQAGIGLTSGIIRARVLSECPLYKPIVLILLPARLLPARLPAFCLSIP